MDDNNINLLLEQLELLNNSAETAALALLAMVPAMPHATPQQASGAALLCEKMRDVHLRAADAIRRKYQ